MPVTQGISFSPLLTCSKPVVQEIPDTPVGHRVWIWQGGRWVEDPDLIAVGDVINNAGREFGSAQVYHHYGRIQRLRDASPQNYSPKRDDLRWKKIRITVDQKIAVGQAQPRIVKRAVFHGTITNAVDQPENLVTVFHAQDPKWDLFGMKNDFMWAEVNLYSEGAHNIIRGKAAAEFNDNAIFNEGVFGPDSGMEKTKVFVAGNRSTKRYQLVQTVSAEDTLESSNGTPVFGGEGGPNNVWTHRQMAEYFVHWFANRLKRLPKDYRMKFTLIGADLLESTVNSPDAAGPGAKIGSGKKQSQMDLRYKPILDCLDEIIRSSGDLTWRLRCLDENKDDSGHEWGIEILDRSDPAATTLSRPTVVNRAQGIVKAGRFITIDPSNVKRIPTLGPVNIDNGSRVNRLVVVGAPRRVMTSLSPGRTDENGVPTLARMWSSSLERSDPPGDGFLDLIENADVLDNEEVTRLKAEKFKPLFRKFGVPRDCNLAKLKPLNPNKGRIRPLFPERTLIVSPSGVTEKTDYFSPAPTWDHPRVFDPKLPIKNGYDYSTNPPKVKETDNIVAGVGEFMAGLAFIVNTKSGVGGYKPDLTFGQQPKAWRITDYSEAEHTMEVMFANYSFNLNNQEDSPGVDFTGKDPDFQGGDRSLVPFDAPKGGDIDDAKAEEYEACNALVITVSLRADDRPRVVLEDRESIKRGDPVRTLVIEAEEFEHWEAIEALVDEEGTILGTTNSPYILRDDFPKMKDFANRLARKLFKEKREGVLLFNKLDFTCEPGDYVMVVREGGPSWVRYNLLSPVMSVAHNLQDMTTTVKTLYDLTEDIQLTP